MAYKQLIKPNLSVKGAVGMCLNYARRVFGIDAKYLKAWESWQKADQHKNRDYPKDVAIPLWFSYYIGKENYGHIVIAVPKKGLYSSPYKSGQSYAVLSSISDVERIYDCKYVGWSTEINDVKVAKSVIIDDMTKPTKAEVGNMFNYAGVSDKDVPESEYKYYMARDWKVLGQNIAKKLYGQKKSLQEQLKKGGDPTSNDQAVKDSLFNKIKGVFGK